MARTDSRNLPATADPVASVRLIGVLIHPVRMTAPELATFLAADAVMRRRVMVDSGIELE